MKIWFWKSANTAVTLIVGEFAYMCFYNFYDIRHIGGVGEVKAQWKQNDPENKFSKTVRRAALISIPWGLLSLTRNLAMQIFLAEEIPFGHLLSPNCATQSADPNNSEGDLVCQI